MFISAFKSPIAVQAFPPKWIFDPTLSNFKAVLFDRNIFPFIKNSLIICVANTILTLSIALPAAYSFARFKYWKKEGFFLLFLLLSMLPGIGIIIGLFYFAQFLGLYDSLIYMIFVYMIWNIPFSIYLLRGYIEAIPPEVEEQAMVDGYSRLGSLFRVTLPLAAPGLGATSMLLFVFSWNEFTLPYFLTERAARPVSTTVLFWQSHAGIMWGKIFALNVIITIPVVILALIIRRTYIRALTLGAVKG